ncbi:MAG: putative restriction endonuclease [Mucilaginibacter sp.]|nr:putative restriction endonuclease [Mucilaginibacter sp.]
MKEGQRLWTKEESVLAINLYCKIPFGQMHSRNADVIELAALIDRSPSSVARKLGNFASFDPKLKERGVKGLENVSKLDKQIWQDYMHDWDEQFIESEKLLAKKKHTTIEQLNYIDLDTLKDVEGKEKERLVIVRVNQSLFRKMVLTNFNNKCCITGITQPELLVASHILPWSTDKGNRLNPKNGLALNTLHDKAFDCGLITITTDLKIKISPSFLKNSAILSIKQNFIDYDGKPLIEPQKFFPDVEFLKVHNERFKG